MKNALLKNLIISAMFLAIGLVLPFLTGQIQQFGNMLLPMHLPVFLCGLICGWKYGAATGFVMPLMRSLIFTMPPFYPTAIAMAFELLTYGLIAGLLYGRFRRQNLAVLYISIITAQVCGRVVWAMAQIILLGIKGNTFTMEMFLSGAFLNAIPGIIVQLVLIPAIMAALDRSGLVRFSRAQ